MSDSGFILRLHTGRVMFSYSQQGSKLTVAILLPGNSVPKEIFWKNKPSFIEIILLFIRLNTIPYGQRHY